LANKVGFTQFEHEYPTLGVVITNNPRYLKGRKVCDTIEQAVETFERWLRKRFEDDSIKGKK
jgi:hypothetical protein